MNQEQYSALCRSTCLALEIYDAAPLINEGQISIDGVKVQLMFDDLLSSDCILCIIELGDIPKDFKEQITESLLMINFLTGSKTTGVYAIDPLSQRASFVVTLINPDHLTGSDLADLLRRYADRNLHLKKTLFMNGELILPLDKDLSESNFPSKTFDLA